MSLIERYADKIRGVISCHDRIVIQGILPGFCFAEGMTRYLYAHQIRIFDYPRFAEPLRDAIRANAERLAQENGIEIEFIRKTHIRKEDIIAKALERRGSHPGLVHILSAMEACQSYKPWHNKTTGKTFLKPDTGKCLHYYLLYLPDLQARWTTSCLPKAFAMQRRVESRISSAWFSILDIADFLV